MRSPVTQAIEAAIEALVRGLDHVLAQDQAAVASLRRHAGARLRIALETGHDPLPRGLAESLGLPASELWLRIADDGLLETASPAGRAEVEMRVRPSAQAVFDLLREGPDGLLRHLRIEGDARLATTLSSLVRTLRWDYEEELARRAGDIPARRAGALVDGLAARLGGLGSRAAAQAGFVAGRDGADLARRPELAALRERVESLVRRVDALAARAAR